ncbi:pimeloyl-ACP methyl ester carboxylesterase [Paenarthrobacter nitroguajacolicus]|uniref:alpha/beta fold hydrolase n=1 Tax=Paenarthrobacter nitroguajacolicus TaxID=211146 RepID=UPI002856DF83|nr:alpha/beta hydrolase [Paenarthrobacter nitroguajacolicus]MDR6988463.1 pimeloyl-ACP methyl ester carboxylesterase [Paenarthrobacter nitroguajacolicus]
MMAVFVLIHGGGSTSWDWHVVKPILEAAGHGVIAVDLPIEDKDAMLEDYVAAATTKVADAPHTIVVGHSLGGFTAPLVCDELHSDGLVYLSAMIPMPGETFGEWWTNTGHDSETIPEEPYFNLVPEDLAQQATDRERDQQGAWMSGPWPGRHPDVPTLSILCRDDQFFPPSFMRRQVRERLGIEPVEIPGGHYATLSHPDAVAGALTDFAQQIAGGK